MKKIIITFFVLFSIVSLFADTTGESSKWSSTKTGDGYSSEYGFKVIFKGVESFNIGFSQSQAVLTNSNGLQTLPFDNNALTLIRKDENAVKDGEAISFYGNCYLYWYVSYISQFDLKLTVNAEDGSTITANIYKSSAKTQVEATATTDTSEDTNKNYATLSSLGESGKVGWTYGSRYIDLSVDVKSYPTDGKVGSLILTLET